MIRGDTCTDCHSLHSTLEDPELVRPPDESLVVYFSALKPDLSVGRITRMYSINTKDMLADGLTKGPVSKDGVLTF